MQLSMKPAKILYFVNGTLPTPNDFKKASEISGNVVFRNANFVPNEEHALEICDGVAGNVPEIYAKRFPSAEIAVREKANQLEILASKVGDYAPNEPQKTDENDESQKTGENDIPVWNPNKKE